MLVSPVPKTGQTCLIHKGICDRLPSIIQRNCIEKGDGKIQQRLQGVSAGMSSYAAICLLKASRAHEEAYSFASLDARSERIRIGIRIRIGYWLAHNEIIK
ncbi:PREDICTED: uncharacterized protein LOC108692027 [Atta colombica]|uniref:uncharacterized protein LOC108692027 n=1 Tax=Atta colombica TaxID=520822 RepID=UPI00084BDA65|nr:PREDICTED: uncharacterized protein LOC108692027 [Atta colombica]